MERTQIIICKCGAIRAAAPDMLDALEGLIDFIDLDNIKIDSDSVNIARAAIKAAKGEA